MSKLAERIAAAEQKLKTLKARQVRAAVRQRGRDAKQRRQDELRRKILVGAVVLDLVERGEIETRLLAKWYVIFVALSPTRAPAQFRSNDGQTGSYCC